MPVRGSLVPLILQTLEAGPLHGYGIARRIKTISKGVLDFKEGTLYPALHSLEQKGWVRSKEVLEKGRVRCCYELTPSGKKALKKEVAEWEEFASAVHLVLKEAP